MKTVSGKKFSRTLERNGWSLLRISGSHYIYRKPGNVVRLSVPIHGDHPLKIGLPHHPLEMAGLSEADLED